MSGLTGLSSSIVILDEAGHCFGVKKNDTEEFDKDQNEKINEGSGLKSFAGRVADNTKNAAQTVTAKIGETYGDVRDGAQNIVKNIKHKADELYDDGEKAADDIERENRIRANDPAHKVDMNDMMIK